MRAWVIKVFNYFKQFIMFSMVGVVNTLIYLALTYLLLAAKVSPVPTNIVAYFLSSILGYFLNKTWVFKALSDKIKISLLKYYVVYGSSLLLSTGLIYLFVNILGISDKLAPLLTICVTTPYNYFFQKLWAFRPTDEIKQEIK